MWHQKILRTNRNKGFVSADLLHARTRGHNQRARKDQLEHWGHLQGVEEEQEHQVEPVPLQLLPERAEALGLGLDPTLHLVHLGCIQLVFCGATASSPNLSLLLILFTPTDATSLSGRHENRLIAGACLLPYMPSAHHRIGANAPKCTQLYL